MLNHDRWLITGGQDYFDDQQEPLKTSVIFKGGVPSPGPELPDHLWKHCLVRINDTHLFMAGGEDNVKRSKRAYLLNTKGVKKEGWLN